MVPYMNSYWKENEEKEGKEAGAVGSTREEKERERSRRTNDFKALGKEQSVSISVRSFTIGWKKY